MTWYTRAPTTPPTTIQIAISLNVWRSKPRESHRRSAIQAATRTPIASRSPYAWIGIGPMSTTPLSGLGIDERTGTAGHRRGRPVGRRVHHPDQFRAVHASSARRPRSVRRRRDRRELPALDHVIHEAVLHGVLAAEDEVAVDVPLDALDRLAAVAGERLDHLPPLRHHLARRDLDVDGLTLHTAPRLVDKHPGVRQAAALPGCARGEQHGSRRRRLAHAGGRDVGTDELHRVVDREQSVHLAARAVDVEVDVLLGVLGLQMQELGHDQVRHRVVDLTGEEDHPLLEQAGAEVEGPLAAGAPLDDGRDEDLAHDASCWCNRTVASCWRAAP